MKTPRIKIETPEGRVISFDAKRICKQVIVDCNFKPLILMDLINDDSQVVANSYIYLWDDDHQMLITPINLSQAQLTEYLTDKLEQYEQTINGAIRTN